MLGLEERLELRMQRFADVLEQATRADTDYVTQAARHLISGGGKRFRPMLVFVASEFGRVCDEQQLQDAALVMELTHVASLYHDDVMDEAELRRDLPSANRFYGNSVAILVGDFLFAQASDRVAELGKEYVQLQARTFSRLVQGQIAETVGPQPSDDPLEHYLQVIADKTGSLIAASACFGAMVAQATQEVITALSNFAEELGIVFQLSDDLIDINSEATGKTPGTDLREGVPTLPVLLLRNSTDPKDQILLAAIDGDLSDDDRLAEVLAELRAHPVMKQAQQEVERRAEVAIAHLAPLPDCEAKEALTRVCRELASRCR